MFIVDGIEEFHHCIVSGSAAQENIWLIIPDKGPVASIDLENMLSVFMGVILPMLSALICDTRMRYQLTFPSAELVLMIPAMQI